MIRKEYFFARSLQMQNAKYKNLFFFFKTKDGHFLFSDANTNVKA